jgi:hypothetical protein
VTRLWLSATAGRESAADWLPEAVKETVNAALSQAQRAHESVLDPSGDVASLEAELDGLVGRFEARLDGLTSKLDDVARRLGLD